MLQHRLIIGILFFALILPLSAQELIIKGKVRDANTHREIPGVNIYIKDLAIGTITNASGRFSLRVVKPEPEMVVTFQHIAYDTLQMIMEDVLSTRSIDMQERVISIPVVEVQSVEAQLEIEQDLPQSVSVLDARIFDLHGFLDAGDLLRTDHSIQVDEELSGKKTVSIRGGSPDEVIVLYNGIKMNSTLDNTFDISLIDLSDVERLEVIKGSNTALYGPEGFSGVVNVIPRSQQDYNVRFQQQLGSFNTNNWGLHFYKDVGNLSAGYSVKRGKAERAFSRDTTASDRLENDSEHHNASLSYHLKKHKSGIPISSLGVMYNRTEVDYANHRDNETLYNFNQMVSARFLGDLAGVRNLTLSAAYQWLDESQFLQFSDPASDTGFLARDIGNNSWHFNANKFIKLDRFRILLGYQFKNSRLNFQDDRLVESTGKQLTTVLEVPEFQRRSHGLVSIAKYKLPRQKGFFSNIRFDLSLRHDAVTDEQLKFSDAAAATEYGYLPIENSWRENMVKFSTHVSGNNGKFAFQGFINAGNNVKFPTLLQQISTRELLSSETQQPNLEAEKINSFELGLNLLHHVGRTDFYGWEISGNVFYNDYDNKFRSYYLPGTPIPLFDNVTEASLTGVEANHSLHLFNKRVTMDFGASRYFFSDASTFPFKHDEKYTINLRLDQFGYSLKMHAFQEGEQVAQIRNAEGNFSEIDIPRIRNLDIHFSKSFDISRATLILNASLRNLLKDDFDLEGLLLRERRYYVTLGIQY